MEYIVFNIKDLKNESHNIETTLLNLNNTNHIKKN